MPSSAFVRAAKLRAMTREPSAARPHRRSGGSALGRQFVYLRSALGGSALRRSTDCWEALLRIGMIVLAVAITVFITYSTELAAGRSLGRASLEAASSHPAAAVVVSQAPIVRVGPQYTNAPAVQTQVRWQAADGSWRFGPATVPSGTAAGTSTVVWLDRAGNRVSPPLPASQTVSDAVAIGLSAEVGALMTLGLAGYGAKRLLDRRRMRQWERDWTLADARWRGRGKHGSH